MGNLGMSVQITFSTTGCFAGGTATLHNVTEIHYNYPSARKAVRIAFESDIHHTGFTYDLTDIAEFEAKLEPKLWYAI